MVANGDVVHVWVRGDNGELKHRYCVVLASHPTAQPKIVLLIFCCTETKANAVWFFRVDRQRWINLMSLDNPSTFHAEDMIYYNASSPVLQKKGTCPPEVFVKLKALYQDRLSAQWPVPVLPEIPAPPEDVVKAAREHELADIIAPNLNHPREAKKVIANVFAAPGRVDVTTSEIRVRLSPAANRSEHAAIQRLLAGITARKLTLPGDVRRRPLRFELHIS